MKTIIDTGPLVALLNRSDRHHAWTVAVLARIAPPLWTCEAVLTEAAYLTGAGEALLEMVATGVLKIGLELEDQAEAVAKLLHRYGERMDLADACVVRMAELNRRSQVFTLDRRDFSIYRRNGRETIALLAPNP